MVVMVAVAAVAAALQCDWCYPALLLPEVHYRP